MMAAPAQVRFIGEIRRLSVGTRPGGNPTGVVANGLRHKIRLQVDGGLKTALISSKRRFSAQKASASALANGRARL